jgi:hypothetical protein
MRKTSVYLSEDEADGLARAAAAEGRSQSELIREGVRRVIAETKARPRAFHSLGRGRGDGLPIKRWDADDLYGKRIGRARAR